MRCLYKLFNCVKYFFYSWVGSLFPKFLTQYRFKKKFGRKINWTNPRDLNEKIQWLKFYSDTSDWTRLADKYRVRE